MSSVSLNGNLQYNNESASQSLKKLSQCLKKFSQCLQDSWLEMTSPEQDSRLIAGEKTLAFLDNTQSSSAFLSENSTNFFLDEASSSCEDEAFSSCYKKEERQALKKIRALKELEESKISQQPIDNNDFYFSAAIRKINVGKKTKSILTGKLVHHLIPKAASTTLRKNLIIAKKIIQLVDKHVPFSANYLQRSKIFADPCYDPENHLSFEATIRKNLEIVRDKTSSYQDNLFGDVLSNSTDKDYSEDELRHYVKQIIKHKTGNCDELNAVGFYLAKNCDILNQTSVEPAKIKHGRHVILVIGRDQNSKFSDFEKWRNGTAMCCVWTRAFFPASELKELLMDYVDVIKINKFQYTQVKLFNPSKQVIKPHNFCKT